MRSTLLLVTLVSTAIGQIFTPAVAQNSQGGSYKLQKGQLGDGSKIIPSRAQVEILDETPIVKDRRRVDNAPTYEIAIPPLPVSSGAQGAGPPDTSRPGVIRLTPTKDGRILAAPGMQSNIPAQGMAPRRDLPSGTSTGVHAHMTTPQNSSGEAAARKPGSMLGSPPSQAHHASPPVAATYAPVSSAQGSSVTTTSTHVKATLKERGQLLK
jgi:hypothetical protein